MSLHALLLLLAAVFAKNAIASDVADCTLDYEYYQAQARTLSLSKPGSKLDDISVHWLDPKYGEVSVTVGGCNHLGLGVTSTQTAKQFGTKTLRLLATELIAAHWPKAHARSANAAFKSVKPTIERRDGELLLRFETPSFDELLIIHRQHRRGSEIEVSAIVPT